MIVDGHRTVRDALRVSLGSKPNLEVLACDCDLPTIEDCVDECQPDVVLLEPKSLNGEAYESCRRLLNATCRPAVIVLTSYYSEQEAMIFTELGVSAYLLKDIDSQSLYQEIRRSYVQRKKPIA